MDISWSGPKSMDCNCCGRGQREDNNVSFRFPYESNTTDAVQSQLIYDKNLSECLPLSIHVFDWLTKRFVSTCNFKLSNQGLHWFCLTSLYDWSRELHHFLNQSDSNLKPNAVSRASSSLLGFYKEVSLAACDNFFSSN